jgi:host factor-I protein
MPIPENLQDSFLRAVRRGHIAVTLFLMNGFQLRGVVTGYDSYAVVVSTEGRQQLIYKHAISTIVPSSAVRFAPDSPPGP